MVTHVAYLLKFERRKTMNWFLKAFADGAATGAAGAEEMNGILVFLIQFGPLILLFGIMYLFLLDRKERKRKKPER